MFDITPENTAFRLYLHKENFLMKIIYLHHANRARGNPSTQADGITELGEKDAKLTAELLFFIKREI